MTVNSAAAVLLPRIDLPSKLMGSWNCCGRCELTVGLLAREGSGGKGSSGDGARPGVVEGWVCCRRGGFLCVWGTGCVPSPRRQGCDHGVGTEVKSGLGTGEWG